MSRRQEADGPDLPRGWVVVDGTRYQVVLVPTGVEPDDEPRAPLEASAATPRETDGFPGRDWWTRQEVADYLRRSLSWVDHQRVLRRHRVGNRVLFKAEDVRDYVETSPRRGQLVPLPRRRS